MQFWTLKWEWFRDGNHVFFLYLLPSLFSLIFLSIPGIRDVQLPLSASSAPRLCDCPGRRRHRLWLCHLCPALWCTPGLCGVQTWLHQHPRSPRRGKEISRREKARQQVSAGCTKTGGVVNSRQGVVNIWSCEGSLVQEVYWDICENVLTYSVWPTDTSLKPLFPYFLQRLAFDFKGRLL